MSRPDRHQRRDAEIAETHRSSLSRLLSFTFDSSIPLWGMSGTDFASAAYWANRFGTETEFEWLVSSDKVIPAVIRAFRDVLNQRDASSPSSSAPVRVLHFGCGTSRLGEHVRQTLEAEARGRVVIEVIDSDYVADSISSPTSVTHSSIVHLDVLAPIQPNIGMFDILLDKSTADAISCGPNLPIDHASVEPLHVLCRNLASIVRPGGRWVCISYSENRFPHLRPTAEDLGHQVASGETGTTHYAPWQVLSREIVATAYLPEGRKVKEPNGTERIVHEPETGIWAYTLERV